MTKRLNVEGIHCGSCANRITAAIQKLAPGARVKVDIGTGAVEVETALDRASVIGAIESAGFSLRDAA